MPRKSRSPEIDAALLDAVSAHPRDLTRVVATGLGVSRQAVAKRARALVETEYLARSGSTRPTYVPGPRRRAWFEYSRQGLAEDRVWREDVAPVLAGLPANVLEIASYGISEMVNNAVDHSDGAQVVVSVARQPGHIVLAVMDDGIGIFRKIARAMNLADERLALLELGKGKFTTDPARHTGEGVFFTSRIFDGFQILSEALMFTHEDDDEIDWLVDLDQPMGVVEWPHDSGTTVIMECDTRTERTVQSVFEQFSSGPDDYSFAKTVVPVRLARIGNEHLISRSQAKRLMHRVEQFRRVVLDFAGIESIGQAFADEVFRVFANAHPEVEIVPLHAVPGVQQMIRRAEVARDRDNGQTPLP